jgi:hypothetical protein
MKTTATQLVTYWTCPFLWHVSYERKEPLARWAARRRFGTVVHAAIAEYERRRRSLERAFRFLDGIAAGLPLPDREEARAILLWRHETVRDGAARPVLIEGSLRAILDGHRLDVRMDRLDARAGDYLLAEYKGGRSVDLRLVRTQLAILAAAVLDVFGRAPQRWQVELLRARKVLELPAETDPAELRRLPARLIRSILEGNRSPEPFDPRFCARCPARDFCPRATPEPRPFSRAIPPPADPQPTLF